MKRLAFAWWGLGKNQNYTTMYTKYIFLKNKQHYVAFLAAIGLAACNKHKQAMVEPFTIDQEHEEFEAHYKKQVETAYYDEPYSCSFDLSMVNERKSQIIAQAFKHPRSIFMFHYNNMIIVGKKLLKDTTVGQGGEGQEGEGEGGGDCHIRGPMLLGIFERDQVTKEGVMVFFKPFNVGEKRFLFNELLKDRKIDIYYPYPALNLAEKKEFMTPGWRCDDKREQSLGLGEQALRAYTINFLAGLAKDPSFSFAGKRVFDPACSTGEFLSAIRDAYPGVCTIGQDLNDGMVERTKAKGHEVYHGDAGATKVDKVDFLFLRFLNSEVVQTEQAYDLFNTLIQKVNHGGYVIAFGHSPVLVAKQFMERTGLVFIQANGNSEADQRDKQSVFQYYVFKKAGDLRDKIDYTTLFSNKLLLNNSSNG